MVNSQTAVSSAGVVPSQSDQAKSKTWGYVLAFCMLGSALGGSFLAGNARSLMHARIPKWSSIINPIGIAKGSTSVIPEAKESVISQSKAEVLLKRKK